MPDIVERCRGLGWKNVRDAGLLGDLLERYGGRVNGMCIAMGWERSGALRSACMRVKQQQEAEDGVESVVGEGSAGERIVCTNRELEGPNIIEKLWNAAAVMSEATREAEIEQDSASFRVEGRRPIGIWAMGDTHIGSDGVNYWDLKNMIDMLVEEDGLYGVINGDVIDGFVANSPDTGRFAQNMRPRFQKRLAKHVCEILSGRIIALVGGQHEFFSSRLDDFDMAGYLATHGNAIYLGPGGTLDLHFADTGISYSLGAWHKYKGNSIYDETAGAKRLYREHGPFDVTMVADKHSPAASMEIRNGAMRAFMRGGTWKLRDDYSKSLGFTNSAVSVPMVILWPDEKHYWTTIDVDEGISYLRELRASHVVEDEILDSGGSTGVHSP